MIGTGADDRAATNARTYTRCARITSKTAIASSRSRIITCDFGTYLEFYYKRGIQSG
jgi:hypothetical protein